MTIVYILNLLENYSNVIIAIANIILIYFIYHQFRDSRKPLLFTKIISREKEVTDRPDVQEEGDLYLAIINDSNNIARDIDIEYQLNFNGHYILKKEKMLSHLNPKEATRIVLKHNGIFEKYPDIFEEITEGNTTNIIPKETLKIDLIVTIHYNLHLGYPRKYEIEDNYVIEWGSRENYPNFNNHPVFKCWNKRNGEFYIYKTDGIGIYCLIQTESSKKE